MLDIHQNDAENTMRELAVREGIFCGVSSGGAVAGALRVARATPGAIVVAIICDRGDRYLRPACLVKSISAVGQGFRYDRQCYEIDQNSAVFPASCTMSPLFKLKLIG